MLHWGKSFLLSLLLTGESFDDFVPNWGNLEMFFFFLFLLHSLYLPHLFTFLITFLSFFLSTKTSLSSHFLTLPFSQTLLFPHFLSSSSLMAPKAKKTSYVLSSNAFHLTYWNGAKRLMGPSLLTYRLENQIPMAEFVSFQTFSHFHFDVFFAM